MSKPLRIFQVLNHAGNQHEMLKLSMTYPVKFSYLANNVRRWGEFSMRPEPSTVYTKDQFEWVYDYEPGKYDLAILHTDQQHIDPNIGKGHLYRQMNEVIQDIPKMVINHGTPMWDEFYTEDLVINGGMVMDSKGKPKRIEGMRNLMGDNQMIVNSYAAVGRWGWGYPLIHGLDPNEWWDLEKEPRPIISLSPGGLDKYYNRQLLTQIKSYLLERTGFKLKQVTVDVHAENWIDYRRLLGNSLIYVNPMKDSPMPRSRTEAMLSGCCVLTSKYQDADLFIKQGVNGFIVPDNPLSYVEAIEGLINYSYRDAIAIGQRGKQTALKYFNKERYQADLWHIITEVAAGRKLEYKGGTIYDD